MPSTGCCRTARKRPCKWTMPRAPRAQCCIYRAYPGCTGVKEECHATRKRRSQDQTTAQEAAEARERPVWRQEPAVSNRDRIGRQGPAVCLCRAEKAETQLQKPVGGADQRRGAGSWIDIQPLYERAEKVAYRPRSKSTVRYGDQRSGWVSKTGGDGQAGPAGRRITCRFLSFDGSVE